MRIFDRLLVLVYVAIAALPVIAMIFKIGGRPLRGELAAAPQPALEWDSVLSERYQRETEAWFERRLGLKGTSIAADNAILYHAFRETKHGSTVRVGVDGVLFNDEDINYYNKHGGELPAPAYVDKLVDQMAEVQARLRAQHRAFVPILIPAKTWLWRDKIPAPWKLPIGDPPPTDTHVYRAFKAALERRGVAYVDLREEFAAAAVPREQLWMPGARHWSAYGGCLALRRTATLFAELTGKPRPAHDCVFERGKPKAKSDDFDLLRLLNAMFVYRGVDHIPAVRHAPPAGAATRPSVLFIGTSFCWTLLKDADASQLYGDLHMNYYNQTFVAWPADKHSAVEPATPRWRSVTLDRELYVLDLFEGYLGAPGAYVEQFLEQFLRELERPGQ